MSNKCQINGNVSLRFQGFYKVQVIDGKTREVIKDYPLEKNLILNGGMDRVSWTGEWYDNVQYVANLNYYAIVGTGSRPNYITSSDNSTIYRTTITQSSNLLGIWESSSLENNCLPDFTSSIYPTYTGSAQIGDTIQYFPSLSESMVLNVEPNGKYLRMSNTYSFDENNTQSFTIWKTSQANLHGETKRGGNGVTDSVWVPNCCGTLISHSTVTHYRTYDFSEETSGITYTEVGVSWAASRGASSSFARAVLPAAVYIDNGQRLRMLHMLNIEYQPAGVRYETASIGGWGADNYYTESAMGDYLHQVINSLGVATGFTPLDPGSALAPWMSSASQPLPPALGPYDDRAVSGEIWVADSVTYDTYVANSFVRYKSCTFALTNANSNNIRSIGNGVGGAPETNRASSRQCLTMLFDRNQTKTDIQELYLKWKFSWSRVLS